MQTTNNKVAPRDFSWCALCIVCFRPPLRYHCIERLSLVYLVIMSEEAKDVDMVDAPVRVDSSTKLQTHLTPHSPHSPSKQPAKTDGPRFEIKKWNAVAMWSWDICADTCAICRNSLNEPSIEYQANPSTTNDNGLSIAFGNCGHVL